jgi:hypothetical protein
MTEQLEYLSSLLGKTYISTHATEIPINKYLVAQDRAREEIKRIANLTDHYIIETATTVTAVDALLGYDEESADDLIIDSESSVLNGNIINQFRTEWVKKEFDEVSRNLKDIPQSSTIDTGYESGIVQSVSPESMPCSFDGTDVIYDQAVLNTILARKKTLSERSLITMEVDGINLFNAGKKLTFDNQYATGYIVIREIDPNFDTIKTTFSGVGEITYNANL